MTDLGFSACSDKLVIAVHNNTQFFLCFFQTNWKHKTDHLQRTRGKGLPDVECFKEKWQNFCELDKGSIMIVFRDVVEVVLQQFHKIY